MSQGSSSLASTLAPVTTPFSDYGGPSLSDTDMSILIALLSTVEGLLKEKQVNGVHLSQSPFSYMLSWYDGDYVMKEMEFRPSSTITAQFSKK